MLVVEPGVVILSTALRHPLVAGKAKPPRSFVSIVHACQWHHPFLFLHCAAQDTAGKLFVSLRNTERVLLLCFFNSPLHPITAACMCVSVGLSNEARVTFPVTTIPKKSASLSPPPATINCQ